MNYQVQGHTHIYIHILKEKYRKTLAS
uniref:Uncharacterized protein n=1 Tax=Anguilla anguilla TaxID=7936 RepID=A0A0E9XM89_ANGAN